MLSGCLNIWKKRKCRGGGGRTANFEIFGTLFGKFAPYVYRRLRIFKCPFKDAVSVVTFVPISAKINKIKCYFHISKSTIVTNLVAAGPMTTENVCLY